MKKSLNILLFISFVITTIMAPVTGIHIHKLAATVFLLLSMLHMVVYRKKLNCKRWLLLAIILSSFVSGFISMLWNHMTIFRDIHRIISIAAVFFLAVHIFVFHKRCLQRHSYFFNRCFNNS